MALITSHSLCALFLFPWLHFAVNLPLCRWYQECNTPLKRIWINLSLDHVLSRPSIEEVKLMFVEVNGLCCPSHPERRGWRRLRVGSAEMYRAVLWISAGDEKQKPQNFRDPVQLHQQVPGIEQGATLRLIASLFNIWKPRVCPVVFRHRFPLHYFDRLGMGFEMC